MQTKGISIMSAESGRASLRVTGAPAIVFTFGHVHLITHEVSAIPRNVQNTARDVRNVTLDVLRRTHALMARARRCVRQRRTAMQ